MTSPVLGDGAASYTPAVSRREGTSTKFQHAGLKNTSAQSASDQTVAASRVYDAFGNVVSSSGSWSGPFGYAGNFGYQEDPNGLKLLGHRYYDSSTGRFLTQDPIGIGRNWFVYCASAPVNLVDPLGYWGFSLNLGGQIIIGTWSGSISVGLIFAHDGIGVSTTVGSSTGIGLYAGIGAGLSYDHSLELGNGYLNETENYATGLATPLGSLEFTDQNGGVTGGGVTIGPGIIGGVYRELRKNDVQPMFDW